MDALPSDILDLGDWFAVLASGKTDEEISDETGLDVHVVALGRKILLEGERARVARTPEDQYAEYRLRIEGVVRELDRVVFKALNPGGEKKAALKTAGDILIAKAKIIDQTVARGQELGILPKAALNKNVKVSGGVIFGAMGTPELFTELARLRNEGQRVLSDYEDMSYTALVEPDIYSRDVIEAETEVVPASAPPPTRVRRKA